MCLILDVNNALAVLLPTGPEDFEPIRNGIDKGKVRLVSGGKLSREYAKSNHVLRLFNELVRAGKARRVEDNLVDEEAEKIETVGNCRSNDQHILALAIVGNIRLLCTNDNDLISDFTNAKILSPKGNVFRYKSHQHLIRKHCEGVVT